MKILLVDDSPDSRYLLKRILQSEKDNVIVSAGSANEAFEALGLDGTPDDSFDMVLLDILMPDINGIEACRRIKQNPVLADTPIIMVTSSTDEMDMEKAFEAGAIDYVSKPIRKVELHARVNAAYRLKQGMDRRNELLVELGEANAELERANSKLEFLSTHDSLTGLPNRRFFDESFEREWKRAVREKFPISVIMADVDHFKKFNDHYGHGMGDTCLKQVAEAIGAEAKRPGDIAARYGGEEFIIALSNADLKIAERVAENIREKVESNKVPHEKSGTSEFVTISIGIACERPGKNSKMLKLLEAADNALYKAKEGGRNRVKIIEEGNL